MASISENVRVESSRDYSQSCLLERNNKVTNSCQNITSIIYPTGDYANSSAIELFNLLEVKDVTALLSTFLSREVSCKQSSAKEVSVEASKERAVKEKAVEKAVNMFNSKFYAKKIPPISVENYLLRIIKHAKMQKSTILIIGILLARVSEKTLAFLDQKCIHK